MNIAVIPARGGSKRIPRKNIKLFKGIPVIAYAINVAFESKVFDKIFVSTDDKEIAEISESFGAIVPWLRPSELSNDFATTLNVMQDTVKKLDSLLVDLEYVCCIYPTTPLLQPLKLLQGLDILNQGDWDYVISASLSNTAPERMLTLGKHREIQMRFPEHELTRTQDLPSAYHDAGQFYWGRKSAWESALPLFTSKSTILELPRESAVDVDTLDDWVYAEQLYDLYRKDLN